MRYQLRDPAGASRSVAYLLMGAGPFMFVTGIVLPPEHPSMVSAAIFTLLTVILLGLGVLCRWRPERMPHLSWLVAPFLGAGLVTSLNLATSDASTGAQLFYLWPVLYAANFLSRTVNYLSLLWVSGGNAAVVFGVLDVHQAVSDWASLSVAMTLTTIVVTSLRNRNEKLREVLERQAYADPLTGVANRRSFDGELARAITWADGAQQPVALLTLDVDYFKKINDTWGHAVGDQALQAVAEALQKIAHGPEDVVGRLGGDEFLVLLRTDQAGALRATEELRALVAEIDSLPCGPPGLSIGVAVAPEHAATTEELTAASDAALYQAKEGGRGRTGVASPPAERHNVDQLTALT
ncbi:GGDEF domain-containing protein [Paractinoplanes rishiriensis]|uniref:GGDEF domain-containing protein n=1 Tax=Paractinoplanes rishiriensis TaxID=1050105 RepID=A0A919MTX3_9ACTN|nr:GGDEF domain-containing protein [Actinoplanes rishiriensis]GIE94734.1 hypothetical protein Ari01nite_21990 [Actinoplanes rishiriensis]